MQAAGLMMEDGPCDGPEDVFRGNPDLKMHLTHTINESESEEELDESDYLKAPEGEQVTKALEQPMYDVDE